MRVRLQAGATAPEKVGDCDDRCPVDPTVSADRDDQVAERDLFMDLFHGWKSMEIASDATLADLLPAVRSADAT
jgi:hypothetical protein